MTAHGIHARYDDGFPLLCDGCPRCTEQAGEVGILLDRTKWARAWRMMVDVEIHDVGRYRSDLDKRLGRELYLVYLILQRHTTIDPENLPLKEVIDIGQMGDDDAHVST